MDISIEKVAADITLGSLFQQIINDMKNSSPLWEDFIIKATKLHACLRAAIQAISSYLEAFQKIADAATNSKGASKEIGTALTRVCLRHKAVETRLKTFTTAIMDSLIIPLQDKLEEWKRQVVIIDKDHTKEYKRCRNELKKRSSDTLRLQKKAKKGTTDLQSLVDSSMQTVNQQKAELDEVERKSLRVAMIEDRTRYCQFVNMLEPVVKQEYEMMYELGHLQEAMMTVTNVTKDPAALPQASEELIAESKTSFNLYPDSPTHSSSQGGCSNSIGSRKSSVCSISSMNSSGSSGSPGHQFQRSLSQYNPTIRLKPGESSDSGFCSSSPALTIQASTTTNQSHAISTWPPPGAQESVSNTDRPHTISSAYERGHQRPALTVYTFQSPEQAAGETASNNTSSTTSQKSPANVSSRPPLPIRCSSLERPLSTTSNSKNSAVNNVNTRQCPSPIPAHVAKEHPVISQPTYVNMNELASMVAFKTTTNTSSNNNTMSSSSSTASTTVQQPNSPARSSTSSLVSPDSSATNPISSPEAQTPQNTPQTNSLLTAAVLAGALAANNNKNGGSTNASSVNDDSISQDISASTTPTNHNAPVESSTTTITSTSTNSAPLDNNYKTLASELIATTKAGDMSKCESPPIDTKSTGSVLDKASMFEKKLEEQQAQAAVQPPTTHHHHPISLLNSTLNLTPATVARLESIYGKKTEEIYNKSSSSTMLDRVDTVEKEALDAIDTAELDNLIGELDLFQREHEAKEKQRLERQHHYQQQVCNGYSESEYQIPKTSINHHPPTSTVSSSSSSSLSPQQQKQETLLSHHHNDSFISTSTTITGTLTHAFSNGISDECSEKVEKVSPSASLNFSITSSTSMMTNVNTTFNCSDSNLWNDNNNDDLSADTGFENPSFRHLNDTNIVLMRDDDLPPNYYSKNATDAIVVLRSKTNGMGSNNNSMTDLNLIDTPALEQRQRLSSFKFDNNNFSLTPNGSPSHYYSSSSNNSINNNSIPSVNKGSHSSFGALMYGQIDEPLTSSATSNSVNVNNNVNVVTASNSNKPAVTPRPASLLSGVSRIARRSSVNTVKPPPPVRRSSSATPSHYSDSNPPQNSLVQNQQINTSSEALPPPPEYLLRSQQQQQQQLQQQQHQQHYQNHQQHIANAKAHFMTSSPSAGQISSSVSSQNVKMMNNDLRTAPHSPGVMRRQLSLINHHPSSNHSSQSTTHSITYSSQPSTPKLEKDGSSTSMFSIYGMTTGNGYGSNDIFGTMPRNHKSQPQQQQHQQQGGGGGGIYAQPKQMATVSSFRTSSSSPNHQQQSQPAQPKQSTGLLASLTARIAPNKSQNQQQQQPPPQQAQTDCDKSRNEPIYQRKNSNQSNQYYDPTPQQQQQQQSIYGERQNDGKNQNYSQSPHHQYQQQHHQYSIYNQNIYVSTNPFITPPTNNYSPSSFGKDVTANYSNYQTGNYSDKSESSVLAKTAPGFLDNLNAKLAEQQANKAYAVRSYINSKVVPDPRIVRESLMDQIKRGATLKQTSPR